MTNPPFRSEVLKDRICVVTGGGSGICFGVTLELLRSGCKGAVICGRRESFLQKACRILSQKTGKTVLYCVCDVRKPEMCEHVVNYTREKFGRLDILINGAAGNFLARADQISPKGFATVMAIDTLGTFNMCSAAYSLLKESPSGIIINISATLHYGATWWQAHASAAKSAVDSLTRSLALEWGSDGIRVNGIAPGPIADTPGTTKLAPGLNESHVKNMMEEGIPLGRMGEAREIGETAVFLSVSEYITGHTVVVDGGEWMYRKPLVPAELVAELSRKVEKTSRSQVPRANL